MTNINYPETQTLPSGKTAEIRKGKGFDLLKAQRKAKTTDEIPYALLAELVTIDGEKLVYEDILELDLADVSTLLTEINKLGELRTQEGS